MQYEMFGKGVKLLPDQPTKLCRMCKSDLPICAFNIDRRSTKGKPFYRTACRDCEREKGRDTEVIKKSSPKPINRTCECCQKSIPDEDRINFDHCPKTMSFRGWICTNCNTGIGKLGDSLEGVYLALQYLRRHNDNSIRH